VTKLDAGTPCPADGELLTVDTDSPKGSSHPLYPDLLNPDAVDAFLELGCEPYLPHIGPYIESAVPFLFTDEPCVCNPPWNEDLVRAFEEEKGYAITDHLNALFEQDEKSAKVRIDYIDVWSKRFAATFFARMRRWCHENSMAFGGHLGGDDTLECLRRHGYGNPLRMYREMDVPGWTRLSARFSRVGGAVKNSFSTNAARNTHRIITIRAGLLRWRVNTTSRGCSVSPLPFTGRG
jgi:hypothetical protein